MTFRAMTHLRALLESVPGAILACALACLLAWHGWSESTSASVALSDAQSARDTTQNAAENYLDLATRPPLARIVATASSRRVTDASTMVSVALEHAGLNPASLRDAVVEADAPVSGGYVREGFRVTLDSMEPRDIGRFLATWREREPLWIVSRLDLTRTASSLDRTSAYRVSLSMASLSDAGVSTTDSAHAR